MCTFSMISFQGLVVWTFLSSMRTALMLRVMAQ